MRQVLNLSGKVMSFRSCHCLGSYIAVFDPKNVIIATKLRPYLALIWMIITS